MEFSSKLNTPSPKFEQEPYYDLGWLCLEEPHLYHPPLEPQPYSCDSVNFNTDFYYDAWLYSNEGVNFSEFELRKFENYNFALNSSNSNNNNDNNNAVSDELVIDEGRNEDGGVVISNNNNNSNDNDNSNKKATSKLELDEIQKHFGVPITKAAKEMNVGLTVLKKRCRELNIMRWPHRKLRSLNSLIDNVKEMGMTEEVKMLEEHKRMVEELPQMELTERTKKLRQACFKANYKKRRVHPGLA